MHQATGVIRYDVLGARFLSSRAFDFPHGGGNHGKLRGKRASKTATDFFLHLYQFKSVDAGQELARLRLGMKLSQPVAAVMKSDLCREPSAEVGDPQFRDQEIGKFVTFF